MVRCSGDLTESTGKALERELDLLGSLDHPTLIVNVADCRSVDVGGVLLLADSYTHLWEKGCRLVIVAGTGSAERLLRFLGIDEVIPTFPTEETATRALRGGGPPVEGPATWLAARNKSLVMWLAILQALEADPVEEVMRRITSSHGLCERAAELLQVEPVRDHTRCYLCPLFHALGSHPEDVGCQSLTQPMLVALLAGDRAAARKQVSRMIELIEKMPVPEENGAGAGAHPNVLLESSTTREAARQPAVVKNVVDWQKLQERFQAYWPPEAGDEQC